MGSSGRPASGSSPATPALAARSSPRLRSGRNPAPTASATSPCSDRQHKVSGLISLWRDSDTQDQNGDAPTHSSSSKKRKRNDVRSYLRLFKMPRGATATDVPVDSFDDIVAEEDAPSGHAAPDSNNISKPCEDVPVDSFDDIVAEEDAPSGHAAPDSNNISKPCEGSGRFIGKHKRLSSLDDVYKLSKRVVFGSHENSETVGSTPFPETEPMFSRPCTTSTLSPPPQRPNDMPQQKEGVKKLLNTPKNLHVQLKQELSKLIKVLQLPDNVRFMADQLFEYVLNNHQVVAEPVGILHAFNIALCWRAASLVNFKVDRSESLALAEKGLNCECDEDFVALMYRKLRILEEKIPYRVGETSIKGQPVSVEDIRLSWQETSSNVENDHMFQNKEMDLHGKFTNGASQEISTVAEQIITERQEPVQETRRECHMQNDEIPSVIVEKSIDLVGHVFSLREKNILCKQQLEISGLVAHRRNNVIRLKEVCSLVLEHIRRRSHVDEMTRREEIKLADQWFSMLMYAFLEHMKLQHEKLEGLQSDTWSSERQLKENLHQVAKSGQLDQDFDQRIPLPDSNFVMEEFIHFKEQNDEYHTAERFLSHCQQLSNAALLMEITSIRNEVFSELTCIQAMESELVETSEGSRGGSASEPVDFSENTSISSSDGIDVQSDGCSSSAVPSDDDSIGQEASTSECRNNEQIKIDSIAKPSMLLGGAASLVRGVNLNNDDTIDTDGNHLESPILASSQSIDMSVQHNVAPSRCPVEAEHTGLLDLGTEAVPDDPLQKMPDDRSQTGVQPDRSTGLPLGAAETSLHLGDARMQGQGKCDGNLAVDPVLSESPTYPADSPVTLQVSTEVETQTRESSMPATQNTTPPAQQSILGRDAASDLQPEVQPSTSMQDEPEEAEDEPGDAEDEPEAVGEPPEAERAATLGAIAAQALQPEMQSSTSAQDVPFERTYLSGMPMLHSPTIHKSVEPSQDPHAGAEPVGMVVAHGIQHDHGLQSEILPSAPVPAKQNTRLLAQQSLATSQHSPAEAEPADIVRTEPACNLQPSLGEVCDEPAGVQSCILGAIAAQSVQPETQPSTSTQSALLERTRLFVMPLLQSLTVHHGVEPSLNPHARAESTHTLGSLTAHVLQPEVHPSASMQHRPAEGLKNELHTFMHCNHLLSKYHEHKKALLVIECNQEIEKIKKKYASLLQKEDSTYLQAQKDLTDIHRKAFVHKSLAESFQREMTSSAAAQGRSTSPVMERPFVSSSAAETAASPVTSSWSVRPLVCNSPGSFVRPSFVAPRSSIRNAQPQSVLPGNLYGTTPSPLALASVLHGSHRPPPRHLPHGRGGSAGAQLRAPARLVQQLRMPQTHAIHIEQDQLPAASPGVASLGSSPAGIGVSAEVVCLSDDES